MAKTKKAEPKKVAVKAAPKKIAAPRKKASAKNDNPLTKKDLSDFKNSKGGIDARKQIHANRGLMIEQNVFHREANKLNNGGK